jgi:UDP-glucose 4-epimerase
MADIIDKKIIVTGGAGFIGSNLVERLAQSNDVTVVDNMHTGCEGNLAAAMSTGRVRLLKLDSSEIAKSGVVPDLIFHLGMYSSSPMYKEDPHRVGEVSKGAVGVLEYAKKTGAHLVIASTSSLYNDHATPAHEGLVPKVTDYYTEARYGVERLAELYSTLHGVDVTCLRLFSVYGPHEENKKGYANLITQFMWGMQKGERPLIYGDGMQTRDFTYVDDVVDAFVKASGLCGFNVFNVGTGKSYTINELVGKLNAHLGTDIKPTYKPLTTSNYVMHTLADTGKASRELGFTAKYALDDGIERLLGK